MTRHLILVEVLTDQLVTDEELAEDVAFTMGLSNGVAGGYIGEPEEHAFYRAESVQVHTWKSSL